MRTVNRMDYQPGCLARSLAGRDKDQYYVILSVDGERVLLSDGRTRTQKHPKRKNKRHIQVVKSCLIGKFPVSDEEIYARLKSFVKSCGSAVREEG